MAVVRFRRRSPHPRLILGLGLLALLHRAAKGPDLARPGPAARTPIGVPTTRSVFIQNTSLIPTPGGGVIVAGGLVPGGLAAHASFGAFNRGLGLLPRFGDLAGDLSGFGGGPGSFNLGPLGCCA